MSEERTNVSAAVAIAATPHEARVELLSSKSGRYVVRVEVELDREQAELINDTANARAFPARPNEGEGS